MKKITSIFSIAVAAMAMLVSCSKSEMKNNTLSDGGKVYTAYSDADTKTAMDGLSTKWLADDTIWGVDMTPAEYVSNPPSFDTEDGHKVSFTFPGLESDLFLAIYPSSAAAFDMQDYACAYVTIPSEQTAVKGGFSNGAAVSVAFPEEGSSELRFMNLVSFVGVKIQNENIVKVELEDIDAIQPSQLAGKFSISPWDGPSTSMTGFEYPATSTKVSLSGTFEKGGLYYFCVAPREGSHGLYDIRLIFTDKLGRTATFEQHDETDPKVTFSRNQTLMIFDQEIPDSKWEGGALFYESFDTNDGTGGNDDKWSGSIASNTLKSDNEGWTFVKGSGAYQCAKFGAGSSKGSATTPEIKYTGNIDIKFKAAAWDGSSEGTTLALSSTSGELSATTVTLVKGAWTEYTVTLLDAVDPKITFSANVASNNRFFLDEVMVVKSDAPVVTKYDVVCATVANGTLSASPVKAAEGATVTLTATPDSGYEFDSWNVTGATVADATSATTTFTMPAANVNVSATFKAVTIPDKTIAEFIAAEGGNCYLTGVVSNITNTTYGNFDLTDESGKIYIYGCLTSSGVDKQFSTLGVEAGDKIKVLASEYKLYGTTDEAVNVKFVEIVKKATKYNVTVAGGIANGTVTVNPTQAVEGQIVTITATPNSGYKVKSVSAKKTASGTAVTVTDNKFTMPAEAVTVSAEFEVNSDPITEKTATIKFGTNDVKINAASVTGKDDKGNSWTITTVGTTSFTANADYYQVGSSKAAATSITFTTTLPSDAEVTSISAKFGGFSGTAGTVTLKVGNNSVGTGSLNAANDVIVTSTSTASGNTVTITVTGIAKGVKVYNIETKYKSAN